MCKVLVIDDDPMILELLSSFLDGDGFTVVQACNGKEGIERFHAEQPDLVLTDIAMPEMDGISVLRYIKTKNPGILAIIMTGVTDDQTALEVLKLGGTDFFMKPINLKALGVSVAHYMSLIKESCTEMQIVPLLDEEHVKLTVPNTLQAVTATVAYLVKRVRTIFAPGDVACIRLGLDEMMINACQHGNLEITAAEKEDAIENNYLESLFENRAAEPRFADRRIRIDFRLSRHQMVCSIANDGKGFDWRGLPTTLSMDNLWEEGGRGVLLTALQFDEMKFNDSGTAVTLIKNRSISEPDFC